ncbi:hypothetical protein QVD17_16550 [Tagetes erecta]|uniref:Uncharacterized protein n=1 Tax=Tagetes erecta TaxID=13708 RepID=A0AAD8KRR0_TARER|nr:hypothetical protein QVD17_16550 [Tagetes erecta]
MGLVDEVPDDLLDDDEYFARHLEDEEDDDEDSNDDGGDDAESESDSEEAEPMEVDNVVIEEPAEVASKIEEDVVEIPRDVSVTYVRKKKKVVEKPEEVNVIEIAQAVMAEAESIAQIDEVDAGITDPIPTISPQIAENIGQEAEKEMLEKELEEMRPKKAGSSSDKDFSDDIVEVTGAEVPKVYLTRARGVANAGILVESPIIVPDEAAAETVKMDKAEGKRKIDAIPEIFGDEESSKRAKIDKPVQIEPIQSVAEVEAETEIVAEVENISEADTEIVSEAETEVFVATDDEKEVNSGDTVQIEPIQSEAGETVDKPETETITEVASQFEPVQTDDAPLIEALDDLDIDWTESEDEAEPEPVQNTVEEVPDDLDQRKV